MQRAALVLLVLLVWAASAAAQQSVEQELRAELARIKEQMTRIEALLEKLERERGGTPAAEAPAEPAGDPVQRAPALNTPPALPPSRAESYRKIPPRIDVLLQFRGDFFADTSRADSFFLRKAEVGFKGHITEHTDFVVELDPVRPNDAFRRTYIRLTHFDRLHVKLGLEKAPVGLDELSSSARIPFVERSEVSDRFSAAEQLGAHLESRWDRWLLQFSVFNGNRRAFRDDNSGKDVAGRVVWAPQPWASVGLAAWRGSAGPERLPRRRYNTELKLGSSLTGFQGEFFRARDAGVLSSAYYLAGFWAIPARAGWLTHIQPVARYEFLGRSDRDAAEELRLVTFGFSLLFDEHRSKFQVNYLKDLHTGARKDELRAQYQVEF